MGAAFLQHGVDGLILGAILALPALGLALVWRIQGFPHLAHGSLMTVPAYAAWLLITRAGLPIAAAVVLALGVAALAGTLMHLTVYRRLAGRAMLSLFIASVGLELILRYGIIFAFGSDFQSFPIPPQRGLAFGDVTVRPVDLLLLGVALAALAGVWWMFRATPFGRRMRAVADNADIARLSGINLQRVLVSMWVLVSVLAGASGILLAMRNVLTPTLGWDVLLLAFAAAILGGITNPFGAAVGAFLIGIVSQIGIIWIPANYGEGIAFVLIALVLMVRPRGLFGEALRA